MFERNIYVQKGTRKNLHDKKFPPFICTENGKVIFSGGGTMHKRPNTEPELTLFLAEHYVLLVVLKSDLDVYNYKDTYSDIWISHHVGGDELTRIFSTLGVHSCGKYVTARQSMIGNMNASWRYMGASSTLGDIVLANQNSGRIIHIPVWMLCMFSRSNRKEALVKEKETPKVPVFVPETFEIDKEDKELLDAFKTLMHLSGESIDGTRLDYRLKLDAGGYTHTLGNSVDVLKFAKTKGKYLKDFKESLSNKFSELQSELAKL